jgi:hypothetical protein
MLNSGVGEVSYTARLINSETVSKTAGKALILKHN